MELDGAVATPRETPPPAGAAPSAARVTVPPYRHEPRLFRIALVVSIIAWLVLVVGTFGIALVYLLAIFIGYLFVQSAFISYLKGTAVEITAHQFPTLHERVQGCSAKLGLRNAPRAYLLNGQGLLNALATRFLGRDFLVLFSDVVDALERRPQALNFYIGHELGHLHRKHLTWGPVLWPASVLPLLGAAYSRAREYTCDSYGQACCEEPADAAFALAVLAAGPQKWSALDVPRYAAQAQESGGFWMSFHELVADYPWLVKRMERVKAQAVHASPTAPRRHLGAWILALFVPRVAGGGAAGLLVMVMIIGVLAAVAIPAYMEFQGRALGAQIFSESHAIRDRVSDYIVEHSAMPASAADVGLADPLESTQIASITFGPTQFELTLIGPGKLDGATVVYEASVNDGRLYWDCSGGSLPANYRPEECR